MRTTTLRFQLQTDPDKCYQKITEAYAKGGTLLETADVLGISTAVLTRLCAELVALGYKRPNPNPTGRRSTVDPEVAKKARTMLRRGATLGDVERKLGVPKYWSSRERARIVEERTSKPAKKSRN